jgi:hypothetical protein
MSLNIVGCGLAGLLAANMLRHRSQIIHEVQPSLPNNHSAVLRFRTSAVGDVLNIPFTRVKMIKAHIPWKNEVADALAYSFKNSGKYRSDRSITAGLTVADRWIAPQDLISRMAEGLEIMYGEPFKFDKIESCAPIISTLPMPVLMKALDYPNAPASEGGFQFNSVPGLNIKATIADCDAYISLLVPDPDIPFSRISITGNEMIVEASASSIVRNVSNTVMQAASLLGISNLAISNIQQYPQKYAKITPIDDGERKAFMHWATITHNIYSLGRFACWRPNLLLDDLIQDVRKIDSWLSKTSKYDVARDR